MMKLSLLPPLILLCSDLLFQKPFTFAFPVAQHNPRMEQAGVILAQASPSYVSSRRSSNQIFHHPTGLCVLRKSLRDPLVLAPCDQSDSWNYTPQKFLTVKGTYFCLQAVDSHKPAKLGIICTEADSKWEKVHGNDARFSLLTTFPDGQSLCLDIDPSGTIVTNPCGKTSESDSQWFEVIPTKRGLY
ncbi:hypothetical protein Taro_052201 [Colocasia esculenta]|uniref:Ricin B lectin domain-containing protein n=1 Tax=Colocasia esculenta TaxID=4460 RepID=A0A843XJ52_COLES|nr:hypothetical protein [Colocasia esculenta]